MIEAVLIGASAGGMKALTAILPALPKHFGMAVIVAQHLHAGSDGYLAEHLNRMCEVRVKDADEKEAVEPGTVYIAPARYHLLVEEDSTLSLSGEPHVNYARPSIDVLFESAVEVFEDRIVGIILTGANSDGAQGLAAIKKRGGTTVVQDPLNASSPEMPRAAIHAAQIDHILTLPQITSFLRDLDRAEYDSKPIKTPHRA